MNIDMSAEELAFQAEVSDLYELNEHKEKLQHALNEFRKSRDYDFAVLMVITSPIFILVTSIFSGNAPES